MLNRPLIRPIWFRVLIFFGFWTVIGLSFASQFYLSSPKFGNAISWGQAVIWALGDWYVWAILSLPIIWLARNFPLARGEWLRNGLIHLAASGLFSLLYMVLRAWLGLWQSAWAGQTITFMEAFAPLFLKTFHFNLLIYWVIVSVTHAFDYYRKFQERELQASDLEKSLAQAKLQALQMQLNPHFLFNTLHAISALMHKDVDAAERMIARLSDLLRYALESTDAQEVPLEQELTFLERYLEIEKTRFGERLTLSMKIDPGTLRAQVPNLVLQPLVENAIRHGIEPHAKPGRIEICATREREMLKFEIRDNGAGLTTSHLEEGVGLSNTRARLEQLYGDKHQLNIENSPGGGVRVDLSIPFRIDSATPGVLSLFASRPATLDVALTEQ
jgi:two-component system, LytTR family, sensor kinase